MEKTKKTEKPKLTKKQVGVIRRNKLKNTQRGITITKI